MGSQHPLPGADNPLHFFNVAGDAGAQLSRFLHLVKVIAVLRSSVIMDRESRKGMCRQKYSRLDSKGSRPDPDGRFAAADLGVDFL